MVQSSVRDKRCRPMMLSQSDSKSPSLVLVLSGVSVKRPNQPPLVLELTPGSDQRIVNVGFDRLRRMSVNPQRVPTCAGDRESRRASP